MRASLNTPGNGIGMNVPLRIAIADDHTLFREGLKSLLASQPNIRIVAETGRVEEIAPMLERTPCDVLLLDLQMNRNALEDIPAFAVQTAVVVVTADEQRADALMAIRAGARAIVFKRYAPETLLDAVRTAATGQLWMPPSLQSDIIAGFREPAPELTPREREIIRHVARGLRNAEVAQKLFITEQTVKTHLNNIFQKLGVRDRVELTLYAVRTGIVGMHEEG
jgi:DNA-binding NarL/FixJ family response regulator